MNNLAHATIKRTFGSRHISTGTNANQATGNQRQRRGQDQELVCGNVGTFSGQGAPNPPSLRTDVDT